MTTHQFGNVKIELSDLCPLPEDAGKLSTKEILELPKNIGNLQEVCAVASYLVNQAGQDLVLPPEINGASLYMAGVRLREIDAALSQLRIAERTLQQARSIFIADAVRQVGQVKDHVEAQGKTKRWLPEIFARLLAYYKKGKRGKQTTATKPAPTAAAATPTTEKLPHR